MKAPANRKSEREAAKDIAARSIEAMGPRPSDDEPDRQAEWDAYARVASDDDAVLALYPMTDLGNAERFAARQRQNLRHVAAIGWLAWDGKRWASSGSDALVGRAVHATVRAIQEEAASIRCSDDDFEVERKQDEPVMFSDKLARWGRSSESATRLAAVARHGAPYLTIEATQLDAEPWSINVLNGTIRIDRYAEGDPVNFRPHNPNDMITKLAPVVYDPDATCPTYDRFLADVQPDPMMRRFLHQWGGYSLTGDTGEQKLCFLYGKGRNGKSTLVDAWGAVSGDYGETVPIETFLDQGRGRNAGAATPDLALLPGVRFLRTSEPEKGAKLAESLIKLVTGGEPIQARHLNRDYFKFRPSFKLTMSGNYRPSISGTDEGIWRRVVLVPWGVTVAQPDPSLLSRLTTEGSGILNRLLDGLRDYLENGLILPQQVAEATAEYRDDSDPLGRFTLECTRPAVDGRVQGSALYRLFLAWAKANAEREWSAKGLASALKERGWRSKHSNGTVWLDQKLTRSEIDFAPSPAPPQEVDDG